MAASPSHRSSDDALVRLLTCVDAQTLLSTAATAVLPDEAIRVGALYHQHPDGRLTLQAGLGISDVARSEYGTLRVEHDLPVAEAVRERRPVYAPAVEFPQSMLESPSLLLDAASAYVCLPLVADGDLLGVLALLLPPRFTDAGENRARLRAVATVCAHRWQRLLAVGDMEPAAEGEAPEQPERGGGASASSVALTTDRGRVSMLDLAMANAEIGTFDWDFASGRLVWDERLCRLFGILPKDFDGRIETFFAAVHPEDRPMVQQAFEDSLRTGRYHVVYRIVRPDGAVRWIDAESRVFYLHDGEPRGMIGVAMDRTEEKERESARQARAEFVLNLTGGLTAAVTTDDVVSTLFREAGPSLGARWLAVYLRQEHGPMRLIGSSGLDEAAVARMNSAARRAHDDPLFDSVRSGEPLFLQSREEWAKRFPGDHFVPPADQHAWALLPMTAAEGLVGVCSLVYDRPRDFTGDDRTVLTAAAGLLGQSLARARLHDTRRRYLTELQRLMLPLRLPPVPGLEIAAAYRPGSEGLEVGGDWYDVVPLPEGRVALIIGDVQGHSVQAAGVMGQLRTSMRAYAAEGHGPADLLRRGDQALRELDTDLFATCSIAELDPGTGHTTVARAGHPYPLLLNADGQVRELPVQGGLPLGTFVDDDYPVTEMGLAPGDALLLYTDGLVEQPGTDYADGVADLSERLAWWGAGASSGDADDMDAAVQRLAEPAVSRPLHDDIAVLLVRLTGAPGKGAAVSRVSDGA